MEPFFIFIGSFYVTKVFVYFVKKMALNATCPFWTHDKRFYGVLMWNVMIFAKRDSSYGIRILKKSPNPYVSS